MFQSKFPSRFLKLVFGLFIYGIGVALTVDAQLGLAPWDVLAQGISKANNLEFRLGNCCRERNGAFGVDPAKG